MWWVYALLSALFASLTAIFAKIGVSNVNSNLATAIRTVVILIVAWGIVFVKNDYKSLNTISKQSLTFLIISGIATGLSWIFYFKAMQMGSVSKVAAVDKLSLVFTFIIAVVFLQDAYNMKTIAGVLLISIGTYLMIK